VEISRIDISDHQSAMLSLQRLEAAGAEHRFRDADEQFSREFQPADGERAEPLPSGE
jgi:hypothetical protein